MEHKQIFRRVIFSPLCSPIAVCLIKELHLFFLKLSQLLTSVFFFFLFSSYSPFVVIMKEERRTELAHLLSPDPAYFWCYPEIRLLNSMVSSMLSKTGNIALRWSRGLSELKAALQAPAKWGIGWLSSFCFCLLWQGFVQPSFVAGCGRRYLVLCVAGELRWKAAQSCLTRCLYLQPF